MEKLYYIIIFLPILAAIWFIIVPLGVPRRGKSEFESRIIRQMYWERCSCACSYGLLQRVASLDSAGF